MNDQVIGISACLLGYPCKYNGKHNLDFTSIEYIKGKKIIPVCPEVFGGLTTPRRPAEIQSDGKIRDNQYHDVTMYFDSGKQKTLEILQNNHCEKVILKEGSPSCGSHFIYDGTFTGRIIPGQGATCEYLIANGIEVIDLHQEGQL